jgi:hypothetical protein
VHRNEPLAQYGKKPDHPAFGLIDLDPDKNVLNQLIEVILVTKGYWTVWEYHHFVRPAV